jgi:uncharacterized protein YndB with AHSA1/START domain
MTKTTSLPPISREALVSWDQEAAFNRFTRDFASWWPSSTHSIGGNRVKRLVFECRVGGRIYEELTDGRRFQWGRITGWNAPRSVSFTWHPSREERDAQDVEVRFETDGKQTRVVLTSTGWEKLSPDMQKQRRGYGIGWGAILDVFAGHKGFAFYVFAVLSHSITTFYRITGRLEREIDKAGGRMLPSG